MDTKESLRDEYIKFNPEGYIQFLEERLIQARMETKSLHDNSTSIDSTDIFKNVTFTTDNS